MTEILLKKVVLHEIHLGEKNRSDKNYVPWLYIEEVVFRVNIYTEVFYSIIYNTFLLTLGIRDIR